MEIYTSSDAKREFGDILLKSQREPIGVTRNGKPVAVVMSDGDYRELKLQALRIALIEGEQSGSAGVLDMAEIKRKARLRAGLSPDAEA